MNKLIKKAFTVGVVATTIVWSFGFTAFVPVASSATSGDLIKASLPAVYYYGADGKRYVFPNEKTYKTWYADFSAVKTITDAELATYAIGGNVTYKPGVKMVKITTDPKTYAVGAKGTLRWVKTEAIASSLYGANWNTQIDDVPDAFFTNYTIGTDVNAAADFDKTAVTAAATSINTDKGLSAGAAGDLTISVKSSPAAGTIPASATVNFITYNFCAGGSEVKVSKLSVHRTGLGSDNDFSAVQTYVDGTQKGSNATGDANHDFKFSYTSNVVIPANTCKEVVVKGQTAAAATTGQGDDLMLGLDAASAVTSTAATVTGSFPMYSNKMTINENTTIGSLAVYEGSDNPTSDYTLNVGETAKTIHQVRLQAGSAENIILTQLWFAKAGSQDNNDMTNWELYNTTDSVSYGKLSTFDADDHLVYNFSLTIPKGESKNLTLRADVEDGTNHTVGVTSIDGTVWNIQAEGAYYKYGISPSTGATWTGSGAAAPNGTNTAQTINQGTVTITKSASTPATGNIAPGLTNLALTKFDVIVKGEPVKFTAWSNLATFTTYMTNAELTNCGLYGPDGVIVAGPYDTSSANAILFTDTFIVPTGTSTYSVNCNISSTVASTAGGSTVKVGFDGTTYEVDGGTTIKGTVSNQTITAAPASGAVEGNVMTIAGGALAVQTMTNPPAQGVIRGSKGINFAQIKLDAGDSGEDVKVTKLTVTLNIDGASNETTATDILNTLIKVDGVQYGEIVQPDQTTAATDDDMVFTLSTPIIVPKSSYKIVEFYADIKATADATASNTEAGTFNYILAHAENTAADLTAVGATTGVAITEAVSGTGQKFDIITQGTLTTIISTGDPDAKIVSANSTGNTWNIYNFKPKYENVRLDILHLTLTATAAGTDGFPEGNFTKFYLYNGTTKLAEASTSATPTFNDINFTMTKDVEYSLSVKADTTQVGSGFAGLSGVAGTVDLSATGDLEAVGISSGATINASAAITGGNAHWIYKTVPTFAKVADSNTNLSAGIMEVLRITITADANADVVFGNFGNTTTNYGSSAGAVISTWVSCDADAGDAGTTTSGYLYDWNSAIKSEISTDWLIQTEGTFTANEHAYIWNFSDSAGSSTLATVTIPAGTTKTLYFKVDLTSFEDTGDYFRMEIKDDTSNDIKYWDSNDYFGATDGRDDLVSGTPTQLIPGMPITGNTYMKT